MIERCVVTEAHEGGMKWAEIGEAYDVSRQCAHKRFANLPFASAEVFDWLSAEDTVDEPPASLRAAARLARKVVETQTGKPESGAGRPGHRS